MSDPRLPAPSQPWRTSLTCCVFVGLFATLAGRLHHLQVEAADDLARLGERQRQPPGWQLPARRGSILASDGTPLVVSAGVWNLLADPSYMTDKLRATVALADLLAIPRAELRRQFESGRNGIILARNLDEAMKARVEALDIDHIYLRPTYQRQYLGGRQAAHVLGFVHADGAGGAGIEREFDHVLAGRDGFERYQRDARGRPLVGRSYERREPRPGARVVLTLRPTIQAELEAAIADAIAEHNPKGICGMVVRPVTGEVLAMASWPDFDPLDPAAVPQSHWRDLNIGFNYESGSTMKPLVAGAAVADGIADWQDRIDCENGSWRSPYRRKPVSSHPHGVLSVLDVIAKSDNVGMAKLFTGLASTHGIERAHAWLERYGFGQKTGIRLPGEQYGILPRPERWRMGTVITASFGHGLSVTPIQMLFGHAAVANEGVWMPPRLVDRIEAIDPQSAEIIVRRVTPVAEPRRVLSRAQANNIELAMARVMTEGTGTRLRLTGYSSAGKTGTTDVRVDGQYLESGGPHIGSFVGWAPADPQRPAEVAALVLVNEPRTADGQPARHPNYFGGRTGGPVVQRILQFACEDLALPPDRPEGR